MPQIADFVVVQDHAAVIPHDGLNDWHFNPFNTPGAAGPPGILSFRIRVTGKPQMFLTLNDTALFAKPVALEPGPERSWHETLTQLQLMPEGNQLDLSLQGDGSVSISDVVVFYQVNV